jgi:hypothetical protein
MVITIILADALLSGNTPQRECVTGVGSVAVVHNGRWPPRGTRSVDILDAMVGRECRWERVFGIADRAERDGERWPGDLSLISCEPDSTSYFADDCT